jgi:hypothetical protein
VSGFTPSLGGETLTPVCCSKSEILQDGTPRLVVIGGQPYCEFR